MLTTNNKALIQRDLS